MGYDFRIDELQTLLDKEVEQVRKKAIDSWHDSLHENPSAQRKWIRKAVDELETRRVPDTDVDVVDDPRVKVAELSDQWESFWNAPHPANAMDEEVLAGHSDEERHSKRLRDLLVGLPYDELKMSEIRVTAGRLRQQAKRSLKKARSTDEWGAAELLLLPNDWWEALATLWNHILAHGTVPHRWADIKCAILGKEGGGHRVPGIASIVWRLGGKCIVKCMRRWLRCWPSLELAGGLPGRAMASIHNRFRQDWKEAVADSRSYFATVATDLSKCFDSVDIEQALAVLRALGAPRKLLRVLRSFYA